MNKQKTIAKLCQLREEADVELQKAKADYALASQPKEQKHIYFYAAVTSTTKEIIASIERGEFD